MTESVGGLERADIMDLLETLNNNHSGWSAMMAPVVTGKHPKLAEDLEASFCRTNPVFAQHFARVTFLSDHRKDLPKLETRTLIPQSEQESIAPPRVGEYVRRANSS